MPSHVAGTPGSPTDLKRALTQRQLTMMTIGGAIGVGLFLGSSVTIRLAGPGVILSYLLCAVVTLIVAYSIAEMAIMHPVAGSFGVYAKTYLNEWSGVTVRVTYFSVQILAIGAEVTAVAIYFAVWFPSVPQWMWVVAVSIGLVAINAIRVANFGEFEYWFALLKVVTIVAFILIGSGLVFGLGPGHAIGFANLSAHGGFLPNGLRGVWLAMSLTLTSYMGVEILGVTAGEASQPEKTIPRAMRGVTLRLILFYVLSITVMLAMTPWDKMGSGITGSPFVLAFAKAGIPYAAGIMNLVVITAALSSANTNLYLNSRTLFSLSQDGYAPKSLAGVGANGVPYMALMVSTAGMGAAILLAILTPGRAFLMLYGVAIAGMFFVWMVILFAHLSFRRSIGPQAVAKLAIRLPFSPWAQIAALIALAVILTGTFYVDGLQYSVVSLALFLLAITGIYRLLKR
ncbi:MAG TPA: amino acid permease [Terracidiphilus sp.]